MKRNLKKIKRRKNCFNVLMFLCFNDRGFGVLEVVVVAGIIVIGLLPLVALVMQSVTSSQVNKNKLIAVMLAQEGIELVRNRRDSNWQNSVSWAEMTANPVAANGLKGDGNYRVENNSGAISFADVTGVSDASARLIIDGDGVYRHSGAGEQTPFYRLMEAGNSASCLESECLIATSTVQWQERGGTKNYSITVEMYDWK
ncbi:hypothetical protein A3G56_01505 [Candidatus Falkowbacteria bacterium RIFCSPLOWO2_12_FULL_45_10]|uniref:Type 4 fimbrial biogenesis protein PilX N-terminal domain-containing protein n=1 Tax=Candidatus Falkowbacteria bacterium RIFCSPLOWO2_12_FULL_45_10 TaxID=1797990 RepID=A0A1F5RX63_9BACT|nr:MAG: hypothetical protein A3G56_01505 [Candidatus Falkowbacteria bacterium RIFCSPLOWO2_12_FULL_45_10]